MRMAKPDFTGLGKYSSLALRLGLGILFLLFGIGQLTNTTYWLSFLPPWASGYLPVSPDLFMKMNGVLELILAFFILLGLFTRVFSALAGLHMLSIIAAVGYNDISVRDFAVFMACLALFFASDYYLSLDAYLAGKKTSEGQTS
jgi:uncharacterized membrane protein YphA (DoxX/SURF4 family)